jgi:hypothetical protein
VRGYSLKNKQKDLKRGLLERRRAVESNHIRLATDQQSIKLCPDPTGFTLPVAAEDIITQKEKYKKQNPLRGLAGLNETKCGSQFDT